MHKKWYGPNEEKEPFDGCSKFYIPEIQFHQTVTYTDKGYVLFQCKNCNWISSNNNINSIYNFFNNRSPTTEEQSTELKLKNSSHHSTYFLKHENDVTELQGIIHILRVFRVNYIKWWCQEQRKFQDKIRQNIWTSNMMCIIFTEAFQMNNYYFVEYSKL